MTVTRNAKYIFINQPTLVRVLKCSHMTEKSGFGAYSYVTVSCPYHSVLDGLSISEPR